MSEKPEILYASEPDLEARAFGRVLQELGLAAIGPIDDEARLKRMIAGAGLIVTARRNVKEKPLVGSPVVRQTFRGVPISPILPCLRKRRSEDRPTRQWRMPMAIKARLSTVDIKILRRNRNLSAYFVDYMSNFCKLS
ncbi:hypothetical protein ACFPOD_15625 [Nitratireductor kimnyeongensis]|uniref:Uncharacterized protein n=1 Tax=Nitratireductor kimnyeongensis TaxID=430679 RepID=A0ABW0TD98_9HYPH|nr:hypothetical protein [Nitratireductor kimnyeongensis]QZZ36823.1 hypothetical protein KW403_06765 [Nitratireductor kimnyeongensis]